MFINSPDSYRNYMQCYYNKYPLWRIGKFLFVRKFNQEFISFIATYYELLIQLGENYYVGAFKIRRAPQKLT